MRETEAVVDRLAGDLAILAEENERLTAVPREWLPADVREGDVVQVRITLAAERTEELRREAEELARQVRRQPEIPPQAETKRQRK